jgi:alanyl-tRNA synthetase
MLGGLRIEKSLWLRRSRSSCGTSCDRTAFVTLSHCSRTFHHKTPLAPQPSTLENFRVATTTTPAKANAVTFQPTGLVGVHLGKLSTYYRISHRFYSQSSTLHAMAEVKWTGPLVRKTFLDFFAERGHSIGKAPPPRITPRSRCTRLDARVRHTAGNDADDADGAKSLTLPF